jgi:hypothetical protein
MWLESEEEEEKKRGGIVEGYLKRKLPGFFWVSLRKSYRLDEIYVPIGRVSPQKGTTGRRNRGDVQLPTEKNGHH